MPVTTLYKVARSLDVIIPAEVATYELPDHIIQEATEKDKQRLRSEYAYAGNVLCYFFRLKRIVPRWQVLRDRISNLPEEKPPEKIYEGVPYLEYVEMDELTTSLRIRYKYFKGKTLLYDPQTKQSRENLITHYATAIVRPETLLFEVRASHRRIAKDISYRVASLLSLGSPFTLDLYDLNSIQRFLDWIVSLNNARFEFGEDQEVSSISISAKRKIDLRGTTKFQELYRQGILRGGHATIERDRNTINFRIFFRDGRAYFTSFCSEDDIHFVVQALEKISLGTQFYAPEQILERYFGRSS